MNYAFKYVFCLHQVKFGLTIVGSNLRVFREFSSYVCTAFSACVLKLSALALHVWKLMREVASEFDCF